MALVWHLASRKTAMPPVERAFFVPRSSPPKSLCLQQVHGESEADVRHLCGSCVAVEWQLCGSLGAPSAKRSRPAPASANLPISAPASLPLRPFGSLTSTLPPLGRAALCAALPHGGNQPLNPPHPSHLPVQRAWLRRCRNAAPLLAQQLISSLLRERSSASREALSHEEMADFVLVRARFSSRAKKYFRFLLKYNTSRKAAPNKAFQGGAQKLSSMFCAACKRYATFFALAVASC